MSFIKDPILAYRESGFGAPRFSVVGAPSEGVLLSFLYSFYYFNLLFM